MKNSFFFFFHLWFDGEIPSRFWFCWQIFKSSYLWCFQECAKPLNLIWTFLLENFWYPFVMFCKKNCLIFIEHILWSFWNRKFHYLINISHCNFDINMINQIRNFALIIFVSCFQRGFSDDMNSGKLFQMIPARSIIFFAWNIRLKSRWAHISTDIFRKFEVKNFKKIFKKS